MGPPGKQSTDDTDDTDMFLSVSSVSSVDAWLGNDVADGLAVVDVQAPAARDLQAAGIEAELVHHRGVDVRDVVAVLDGVEADLVGGTVDYAGLDAAAGQPGTETLRMMIAAIALGTRRPAEFRPPH